MAITRNSNTIHIAAGEIGTLEVPNVRVTSIYYCAVNTNADAEIRDDVTGASKHSMLISSAKDFAFFDYSRMPIVFPNGIDIVSNTNMYMILTIEESNN